MGLYGSPQKSSSREMCAGVCAAKDPLLLGAVFRRCVSTVKQMWELVPLQQLAALAKPLAHQCRVV